jgi:hypothetical protein
VVTPPESKATGTNRAGLKKARIVMIV